ncbi:flagellar protein FlaG [Brevibacillus sp. TJ4]|uniref:flagellar protein FlaG n=1 Tax=Brevibacillus sp. TJ4 TaxID=3234853 RepID=UPI0037D3C85B
MEIGVQAGQLGRTTAFSEGAPTQPEPATRPVQTSHAGEKVLSKAELSKEIDGINKWLQSTNTHVKFTLHEELNEYYVQVINDQTQEVIREIPSKKMMDMVAKFHEMVGLLVDEKR